MSDMALILAAAGASEPEPPQDGALYSWGAGVDLFIYKLGTGASNTRSSPVQVGLLTDWLTLAVSYAAVHAVKEDGTLWCWGSNDFGQLGKGNTGTIYSSPSQVGALTNWRELSGNYTSIGAIKADNSLWMWGQGQSGGLGNGDTADKSSPVQIGGYDWQNVAVGVWYALAVKLDGTLWAWGDGTSGQLGLNNLTSYYSPVQVGSDADWFSAAVGSYHTLAIRTDSTLWVWGNNANGQLGTGNTTSRSSPVQVGALADWVFAAAGGVSSYAIKADGTLWGWGRNAEGQLGTGNLTNRSSPVQIGAETDWRWITVNQVTQSYSGCSVLALRANGTLWAWGTGLNGALGTGSLTNYSSPVQVGSLQGWTRVFIGGGVLGGNSGRTTLAVNNPDGGPPALPDPASAGYDLYVTGSNDNGNLAYPVFGDFVIPFYISSGQRWRSISSLKDKNSYGIRGNGLAYSVGVVNGGYLGSGSSTFNPISLNLACSQIAPGILISKGKLYCWGENTYGDVGDGTTTARSSPVQIGALTTWLRIASNGHTKLAIKTDGTLWGWGKNDLGQLGTGNTTNYSSPVQIGALTNWAYICVGADDTNTTCSAVKTNGTLWGWGYNGGGIIGDGTTTNRSSPVQIGALTTWRKPALGFALKTDSTLWQMGTTLTQIAGSYLDVSSAGASQHHAAVKQDGTIWAWGLNDHGQLGVGDITDRSSPTQMRDITTGRAVNCAPGVTVMMVKAT